MGSPRKVDSDLVSQNKPLPRPIWIRNTYFWIGAALLILGIVGLPFIGGDHAIRDPGQKRENNLYIFYLVGSIVAFVNGWLSHRQTTLEYMEAAGSSETGSAGEVN